MRRGQAALEFLTTYGWAFLVILVMIGALAYFGVLNPKNFLPSRCTFSPEVDCLEANIQSVGAVSGNPEVAFRFRNNAGSTADFNVSMVYIGSVSPAATSCLNSSGDPVEQLPAGRVSEVICEFDPSTVLPREDKAKFEVTIYYKKSDGSYWTPIKGELYGTVS